MGATPVQDKWAWVAGPVAVALGLAAHVISGGGAPAMPVLLALVALSALAAQLIARWIHGPILLLLLSGVAQQLLFFGREVWGLASVRSRQARANERAPRSGATVESYITARPKGYRMRPAICRSSSGPF